MIDLSSGYFEVENENGETVKLDVLFSFESIEDNNTYVVYTANKRDKEGNIEIYASYINEEDFGPRLMSIEDDDMFETINSMLIRLTEIAMRNSDEGYLS